MFGMILAVLLFQHVAGQCDVTDFSLNGDTVLSSLEVNIDALTSSTFVESMLIKVYETVKLSGTYNHDSSGTIMPLFEVTEGSSASYISLTRTDGSTDTMVSSAMRTASGVLSGYFALKLVPDIFVSMSLLQAISASCTEFIDIVIELPSSTAQN